MNKVSTKADVRFNIGEASWLPGEVKERFRAMWTNRINHMDEVSVQSEKYRTQPENLKDAMDKLQQMVDKAEVEPKERHCNEGLTEHAKKNRRDDKAKHSAKKELRRRGRDDY